MRILETQEKPLEEHCARGCIYDDDDERAPLSLSLSPSSERKIPGGRGKEGGSDLPLNPLSHPIRGGFLSGGDDDDEMSTSCAAVNSIPLARARARAS